MNTNHPGKLALFAILLFVGAYAAGYYGRPPVQVPAPAEDVLPQPVQSPTGPSKMPPLNPPAERPMLIDPISIVEDSRCPVNANCVWAGTVKVRVQVSYGMIGGEEVLTLGEPKEIFGKIVTVTNVQPQKTSATIQFKDYRFTFDIK